MTRESERDGYVLSDDRSRLHFPTVHRFISRESYWAPGISEEKLARAIENSLCFGVYRGTQQLAFARVVTDKATFAYLCDVFVDAGHRGARLGVWLVEFVLAHPDLQGLRRICLVTRDAHELYRRFGFDAMPEPGRYMELTSRSPALQGALP